MRIVPKYTPFSYEKRIAPLKAYQEEYDKTIAGLETLDAGTNTYTANIPADSESGQKIAAYNKTLGDVSAAIASGGLRGIDRLTLSNLKRVYQQEIQPINTAAKQQEAMQLKISDSMSRHPSYMYGAIPSVDDLVKNPQITPHVVDGKDLYTSGASIASSLSPEAVDAFLAGNEELNGRLGEVIDNIGNQFNVGALANPDAAKQKIRDGFYSGLSQMKKQYDAAAIQRERARNVGSRRRSGGGGSSSGGSRGSSKDPGDNFYTDENGNTWQRRGSLTTPQLGKLINSDDYQEQEMDGEMWVKMPKTTKSQDNKPSYPFKAGLYNPNATLTTQKNIEEGYEDLEMPTKTTYFDMTPEEKEVVLTIMNKQRLTSDEIKNLDRDFNFEVRYAGRGRRRKLVSVNVIKKSDKIEASPDEGRTIARNPAEDDEVDFNIGL